MIRKKNYFFFDKMSKKMGGTKERRRVIQIIYYRIKYKYVLYFVCTKRRA